MPDAYRSNEKAEPSHPGSALSTIPYSELLLSKLQAELAIGTNNCSIAI